MESQTTGKGINYTQGLMQTNFAQQGWQCPICKRVLAPFVAECPCGGQGIPSILTTTSVDNTSQIINCHGSATLSDLINQYDQSHQKHFKEE